MIENSIRLSRIRAQLYLNSQYCEAMEVEQQIKNIYAKQNELYGGQSETPLVLVLSEVHLLIKLGGRQKAEELLRSVEGEVFNVPSLSLRRDYLWVRTQVDFVMEKY